MSIRSSIVYALMAGWCFAAAAQAQWGQPTDPASVIRWNLGGAPVSIISADLGDSRVQPRGGAMVLDLHATLTLQNNSSQNIRGITLAVLAQEMTPGGKGSVAVPSLNVPPGASFRRPLSRSQPGWLVVRGFLLFWPESAGIAADDDGLGNGGAARSRASESGA